MLRKLSTPSFFKSFLKAWIPNVETLVALVIFFCLCLILIPNLGGGPKHPHVRAKTEMQQIEQAIVAFKATYSHWPMPSETLRQDTSDFTYGTFGVDMKERISVINPRPRHQANNSEIVAILMAVPHPTYNPDHTNNPLKKEFLNPKRATDDGKWGLGPKDGIYRDPWGMPYIISIDLNYDGVTKDAFYSFTKVSRGPTNGFNGLFSRSGSGTNDFVFRGPVMI